MMFWRKFIFITIGLFGMNAFTAKFKGYPLESENTKIFKFVESIARVEETETEFLILFSKHAAFYSYPKKEKQASDFRLLLASLIKEKKIISADIDPETAKILLIEIN